MMVTKYIGPPEDWEFWMLKGDDRHKRTSLRERLLEAGLRPTWQRMKIGLWVFEPPSKHFTPEELFQEMRDADDGKPIALATIYNTVNAFVEADMLNVVTVPDGTRYYDTNTSIHYHLDLGEDIGLMDMPERFVEVKITPDLPEGYEIEDIQMTMRLRKVSPEADQESLIAEAEAASGGKTSTSGLRDS